MEWQRFRVAAAVAVAGGMILTAAACGSSSKNPSTPPSGGGKTAAASATAKATNSGAPSSTANASTSAFDQLTKDSNNFIKASYKITYDISGTTAGKPTNGTMTVAHQDSNDAITLSGSAFQGTDIPSGTISLIDSGGYSYLCTEEQKLCLKSKSSSGAGLGATFAGLKPDKFIAAITADSSAKVTSTGGRTIAGHSTKCYNVQSSSGSGTVCFDSSKGMLLYAEETGGTDGNLKLTATSVGNPSSDDFKPPYTVQDLSGS